MGALDDMVLDGSGVFEGALVVAVGVSALVHAWFAWTTRAEVHAVAVSMAEVLPSLKAAAELGNPVEAIDDVREEITDTINGILGSMHVPTAADHLMGTLAAVVQARFLGPMMQAQQAAALLPSDDEPDA